MNECDIFYSCYYKDAINAYKAKIAMDNAIPSQESRNQQVISFYISHI